MRKKIIAGNWKMNLSAKEAKDLALGLQQALAQKAANHEVLVFPSPVHLGLVSEILSSSIAKVGAQNIFPAGLHAMTGETSPDQLQELGIRSALVGHSERRQFLGETSFFCQEKISFLLKKGFQAVYCVGETLAEREKGETFSVLSKQIKEGLSGIESSLFSHLVIAYEPVWAIGTGKVASPEQAEEAHDFIRKEIAKLFVGADTIAKEIRILYGGSVKPDNIGTLLAKPNIDGGLVGGASQKLDSFLKLIYA